ncbi:MAG: DUF1028 domain-containing protein [Phycisphaerae bacterium]|nr:DUF1028 domain-containing protein [Phycisphaerae bacterium]
MISRQYPRQPFGVALVLLAAGGCGAPARPMAAGDRATPAVATFSIVAVDREAGEWGVAVASRFIAVGAVVPWARARAGAVATQALADPRFGPRGLDELGRGKGAGQVLEQMLAADPGREQRQVGVVDAKGQSASFTGRRCLPWAGGKQGDGYCVQGNILAGPAVVEAMATAFEKGEGDLGDRMLAALVAGEAEGGDRRGRQSAALLIVRDRAGYRGLNDRYRDLRVDDHQQPVQELLRIYRLHRRMFPSPPVDKQPVPTEPQTR